MRLGSRVILTFIPSTREWGRLNYMILCLGSLGDLCGRTHRPGKVALQLWFEGCRSGRWVGSKSKGNNIKSFQLLFCGGWFFFFFKSCFGGIDRELTTLGLRGVLEASAKSICISFPWTDCKKLLWDPIGPVQCIINCLTKISVHYSCTTAAQGNSIKTSCVHYIILPFLNFC